MRGDIVGGVRAITPAGSLSILEIELVALGLVDKMLNGTNPL